MYEGQINVLLGHNGAGKTTTMSMLTGNLIFAILSSWYCIGELSCVWKITFHVVKMSELLAAKSEDVCAVTLLTQIVQNLAKVKLVLRGYV